MNQFFFKTILILLLIFVGSCGKKSFLEKYPDSDYPKQYPTE